MQAIRPHHIAVGASTALACLMIGLLLGIVAGGGHVSRVLRVIPGDASTAKAATVKTARSGDAARSAVTITRTAAAGTVTQRAPARTVTSPARTVTAPASTVTVTTTFVSTQTGSTTSP